MPSGSIRSVILVEFYFPMSRTVGVVNVHVNNSNKTPVFFLQTQSFLTVLKDQCVSAQFLEI